MEIKFYCAFCNQTYTVKDGVVILREMGNTATEAKPCPACDKVREET